MPIGKLPTKFSKPGGFKLKSIGPSGSEKKIGKKKLSFGS